MSAIVGFVVGPIMAWRREGHALPAGAVPVFVRDGFGVYSIWGLDIRFWADVRWEGNGVLLEPLTPMEYAARLASLPDGVEATFIHELRDMPDVRPWRGQRIKHDEYGMYALVDGTARMTASTVQEALELAMSLQRGEARRRGMTGVSTDELHLLAARSWSVDHLDQ
jgi:hypothetical protein